MGIFITELFAKQDGAMVGMPHDEPVKNETFGMDAIFNDGFINKPVGYPVAVVDKFGYPAAICGGLTLAFADIFGYPPYIACAGGTCCGVIGVLTYCLGMYGFCEETMFI